jgi:protein O-GlcNAc transferase
MKAKQSDGTISLQVALSHHQAGEYIEAQRIYEGILQGDPDDYNALHLLGVLYNAQGQYEVGISLIRRAIKQFPAMTEAHYNLGNALAKIGQHVDAIHSYDEATRLKPAHANAWLNKGDAYRSLMNMAAAEDCYRKALQHDHRNMHIYVRLGVVLRALGRHPEAAVAYKQALLIDPLAGDANYNLGNLLFDTNQFEQARQFYARAWSAPNPNPLAACMMLSCATKICDWDDELIKDGGLSKLELVHPFTVLTVSNSGSEQLHHARRYAKSVGLALPPTAPSTRHTSDKIRIGYLSADFHQHPTAYLIAELFELHDRTRFEVVGISYGRDDGSPVRQRLIESFDYFIDVADVNDANAVQKILAANIDILVDLKGHTKDARPGILACRPASVIVNYLGYPGTMGSHAIDYILADATVLPFTEQVFYDEKIVHLPGCYQVNDSTLDADCTPSSRQQHGLPTNAFVFCCLNGSQKITPAVFAAWMRVLAAVPHGVLWLYRDNETAVRNLQRAAVAHGIDPVRLVFAPTLPHRQHLARYRHADLFLDTSPYNAHTTGSDALRAHVPILALRGGTFASRVATSLLEAVGVPEMVVDDLPAYEAAAIRLAYDNVGLSAIRLRIAEAVRSGPLFDTRRFAKNIEAAYQYMHKRATAKLLPCQFAVKADGMIWATS